MFEWLVESNAHAVGAGLIAGVGLSILTIVAVILCIAVT